MILILVQAVLRKVLRIEELSMLSKKINFKLCYSRWQDCILTSAANNGIWTGQSYRCRKLVMHFFVF